MSFQYPTCMYILAVELPIVKNTIRRLFKKDKEPFLIFVFMNYFVKIANILSTVLNINYSIVINKLLTATTEFIQE